ncbi:MAG: hypothetical protein NZ527_04950 [Hydrogenobacter thermophilus]|uniref:Uncharacterized protein n=1 Tax=Hydrogenobacter thermophilus (strain DSM 6534 / IAM 12695 / TK-6) TaxID=608538 RepID=D3DGF6_HYDTT|nr:hypothetical protein [Hydrogenobacter thermophilus]ADO44843.1 hypothetical protein Hydth_0442 [Hydrogenobacter thermophilus TK-6]MCS7285050.1 hypothetical protein [Hydrogenobacter thermophilus]QWK20119.1 MAG: hypothetical protein KNN13_01965 [Hydrogenobacter thermophilus]BAI68908.1 hypothetical protein HTH_0444 [Hydrogenobacter thermophilus TK-6]
MALRILERVNIEKLKEELFKRGWNEGKFNSRQAMLKEFNDYLWVAVLEKEPYFLSLPKEESSRVHSEGMKALREEVESLALTLGFSLPTKGGSYA